MCLLWKLGDNLFLVKLSHLNSVKEMPHHSKQSQQQRKDLDGPMTSSPSGYIKAHQSFHNSPRSDIEVSKRNQAPNIWMSRSVDNTENVENCYNQEQYHRVPSSPPDVVGSVQNKRDPSQEIASVLLMAAAAATNVKETITLANRNDGGNRDIDVVDSHGSRPLKKRKSTGQSLVETGTNSDDPYHVSPISHSSKSGATSETNIMSHDTPSTSSAHSFSIKDDCNSNITEAGMKVHQSISRPQKSMYQMILQFPSLMHWILSETSTQISSSKFNVDLSVLQWVSHGQAWRIIRWEAFHREVLPAMFPQLISNATDSGSIDAFLWQLRAWGFQEIRDGPDIGAFAHTVRSRVTVHN